MIKEPEGFAQLVDNLRDELQKERDEVLSLMGIVHHYESMLLNFYLQMNLENLNKVHLEKAFSFAERVSNKSLKELYDQQKSINQINPDLIDCLSSFQGKPTNSQIH